jgi:hypothetical protein
MVNLNIKISTDLSEIVDLLIKVGAELSSVANIPKEERKEYRETLSGTYIMLDTTLNMIILRLGDIMLKLDSPKHRSEEQFIEEVIKLDNYKGWRDANREFCVCGNLDDLMDKLKGKKDSKFWGLFPLKNNWNEMIKHMDKIFTNEREIANYLSIQFKFISEEGRKSSPDIPAIYVQIRDLRNSLDEIRQKLIESEVRARRG